MDIRALLLRCRHAREELKALRRQLTHLDGSGGQSKMERYQALLTRREQEAVADLVALEEMIGSLSDVRTRTVMRYYYTMGMTDTQIGEEMDITDEWVRKKRYAAVRWLERNGQTEQIGA